MSSRAKVMDGTWCCTKWHRAYGVPLSLVGIAGTCVGKDSELASASLSASLVSFERRSSSCRVIQVGILASYANMSNWKGTLRLCEEIFFNAFSNWTSFCFSLSSGWDGAWAWIVVVPDVVGCCVSSGIWLYCRKYHFPDRPTGWEVAGCAAKANFYSFESLREATVTVSSSVAREMVLHDLSLSLSLMYSYCLSLTIHG